MLCMLCFVLLYLLICILLCVCVCVCVCVLCFVLLYFVRWISSLFFYICFVDVISTEILLRSKQHGLALSDKVGDYFGSDGDFGGFSYNGEICKLY
jgi:hypothetical protein